MTYKFYVLNERIKLNKKCTTEVNTKKKLLTKSFECAICLLCVKPL